MPKGLTLKFNPRNIPAHCEQTKVPKFREAYVVPTTPQSKHLRFDSAFRKDSTNFE